MIRTNKMTVTVFCKLAIFWAVIQFSKNFTVNAPKRNYDRKHQRTTVGENEDSETRKNFSQIANLLVRKGVLLHL